MTNRAEPPTSRASSFSDGTFSIRDTLHDTLRDFWRCLPDLVLYDIVFKIIGFVLLSPLAAWLFRMFVSSSGNSAVGNFDIAMFLLTPSGLAMAVVVITVFVSINFLEQAGLIYIGFGATIDRRYNYVEACCLVSRHVWRVLGVSLLKLLIYGAVAAPFALLALGVASMLLTQHDINYYLTVQPAEFWTALALGSLLAIAGGLALVMVYVLLIFLLPGVLLRDESIRSALRYGRSLVWNSLRYIARTLIAWLLLWGAISLIVHGAVYLLGYGLIALAGQAIPLLLLALGVVTAINIVVTTVLTFVGMTFNCLLIVRLYRMSDETNDLVTTPLDEVGAVLGDDPQWSVSKKVPLGIGLVALVIAAITARQLLESVRLEDNVDISAHRGSSLVAPENTLSAVKQAIADGATFAEIDVQTTADGVLVVAHDADLMRVAGKPLVITETPYDALRDLDVGSHFGPEFTDEPLPTLDQVIDVAKGRVKLIVELKSYAANGKQLGEDVVDLLRARDMLSETSEAPEAVIMSLKYGEVEAIESRDPEITTGFVSSVALGDISRLKVDFLAVSISQATDAFIGAAHAQAKDVYVWTVDDRNQMSTMVDRGVDNVITNDPATLVGVLRERAQLGNAERLLLRFRSLYVD